MLQINSGIYNKKIEKRKKSICQFISADLSQHNFLYIYIFYHTFVAIKFVIRNY